MILTQYSTFSASQAEGFNNLTVYSELVHGRCKSRISQGYYCEVNTTAGFRILFTSIITKNNAKLWWYKFTICAPSCCSTLYRLHSLRVGKSKVSLPPSEESYLLPFKGGLVFFFFLVGGIARVCCLKHDGNYRVWSFADKMWRVVNFLW